MAKETSGEESLKLLIILRPATPLCSGYQEKTLILTTNPKNGLQLKQVIETELQIPVCVQKIFFDSVCVSDKSQLCLRQEDVLTVEYTTEADTEEIHELIERMQTTTSELMDTLHELSIDTTLSMDPETVHSLIQNCFRTKTPERGRANRLHFIHNHGIEIAIDLYRILSSIHWSLMNYDLLSLERAMLNILCDISSLIGARCMLLRQPNVIKHLCMSVLKKDIVPYQYVTPLIPIDATEMTKIRIRAENYSIIDIMIRAMGVLTNLSELSSKRLEIVSQPRVIEQMTSAMLSQSISVFCIHVIISALLNLSYSPETHPYLTAPPILHGVIEACKTHCGEYSLMNHGNIKENDIMIIQYFTTLFFSFLSTGSTAFITSDGFKHFSVEILKFMKKFLKKYSHTEQVKQAEKEAGYSWSTMIPLINLVYFDFDKQTELVTANPLLRDLYMTSVQAGLFSLKMICSSPESINIMEQEGIIDYIICLPWYINNKLTMDARDIAMLICQNTIPAPPRLVNIAKARICTWQGVTVNDILSPSFIENVFTQLHKN